MAFAPSVTGQPAGLWRVAGDNAADAPRLPGHCAKRRAIGAFRPNMRRKSFRAKLGSATNAELLDQSLVAGFVGRLR